MASQRSGSSSPSGGDHYNSETAGGSCWSPRTWHLDDNLGLRADDTAPRSNAPRDSGRQVRVHPRQEARLASPAHRRLQRNPAEEHAQASPTRPVRSAVRQHAAHLPASRPHFAAQLCEQPAQASVPPLTFFRCFRPGWIWCFRPAWIWSFRPAWNYAPGHAYRNQDPE